MVHSPMLVQDAKCGKCGDVLYALRFPNGYAATCKRKECQGNGDGLVYHLTPEAAIERCTEGRKRDA